jgi:hypothetical protein
MLAALLHGFLVQHRERRNWYSGQYVIAAEAMVSGAVAVAVVSADSWFDQLRAFGATLKRIRDAK